MQSTSSASSGAPCWVSLTTRDMQAAQDFYRAVLGWRFRAGSLGEDFSVAISDGVPVAGVAAVAHTMGIPVSWTAYFAVADADLVAARIRERSATVAVGPLALGKGRAALAADPAGASFGFWEGEVLPGWHVGNGSAPAWLELRTMDAFAAAIFYGEVFDWVPGEPGHWDVQYEDDVVMVRFGGQLVAGLRGGAVEAAPSPQIRPRWQVHFRVDDVDACARRAAEAGGTVVEGPQATARGRTATLRDPAGGLFTVEGHDAAVAAPAEAL
ncbi:VOC family protein [Streptomyces sp. H27-D2]|uniref:VOC family protein n=1 Tax=Streptomyces sp. H27-D2 TaxID=3046304 RepID=UPI002DB6C9C7|nr:VOC family protein [Streptomyces sp. H27-D2]MEC4020610.1 VOC family protein [Streptomyces sp. H27-D2]